MNRSKKLIGLVEQKDRIWVRLGDQSEYEEFDTLEDAAEYLRTEFGVEEVDRWVEKGFEGGGYLGQDYVSMFWGDADAQPTADLSHGDKKAFEKSLTQFESPKQEGSFYNQGNRELAAEIDTLSSGTIGTLTGFKDYKEIQRFQDSFANWVYDRPDNFQTWQNAFHAFMKHHNITINSKGKANPDEIRSKLWFEEGWLDPSI